MKFNFEKNNAEANIPETEPEAEANIPETEVDVPEHVLDLYRIYGYKDIDFEHYLKSKKTFESKIASSEINQESENLLARTRNEILEQPKDQIAHFLLKALENNDIEIQRIGASLVQNAPENQRKNLGKITCEKIIDALSNPDIQIQRIAINMVQFAPENKKDPLREIVLQKIIDTFDSNDVNKWRIMAKKIKEAPEEAQAGLREIVYVKATEALNNDDIRIQRLASTMLQYAPENKQTELQDLVSTKFKLAKQQGKFSEIVESPLYMQSDNTKDSIFSHEAFSKTGSETTLLLGKQFRNNLIMRHFEEPCFSAWKKAYENHQNWTDADFDYVPIEPIYSFGYDSDSKLVNVASGVLDISLEEWYAFSGDTFRKELDEQKTTINKVLSGLGIDHGHANDANFCLRFYRNENGDVDINRTPRIYLIDFDKAIKHKA